MPTLYEPKVDFTQLSERYAGKWVALHPATGEVLAVGSSLKDVVQAAASTAVDDPIITKVEEFYGTFIT